MAIYSYNKYGDNLAQTKRRRFFIQLSIAIAVIIFAAGLGIYGLFYRGWLDINSISVNGLKSIDQDRIFSIINSDIENSRMPILGIKYKKNTYFFDPVPVKESIMAQFSIIKDVVITKKYPHGINIKVTERTPAGTWCFQESCSYFDYNGILWGKALKSYGSLLLTVEDKRQFSEPQNKLDKVLLENIKDAIAGLENLNIKTSKVEIRPDSINDFIIHATSGFYVIFTEEIPLAEQFKILNLFLEEKGPDFKPQYIDIRIKGRVYYK